MAIQLPNPAVLNSLNQKTRRSLLVAAFTLLLLRARIADIPKAAFSKLKKVAVRQEVSQDELAQALQQVYVDEPDGSKTLLVPYKGYISKVRRIAPPPGYTLVGVSGSCGPWLDSFQAIISR